MRCIPLSFVTPLAVLVAGTVAGPLPRYADAATVSMTSDLDNTLFQFDPDDPYATMNANGEGNFFGAGVTRSRSQIQRGLIHFDLTGLPAGTTVVPGTASLRLYIVDSPGKDPTPRPFWLVRLTGLEDEPWGEGPSSIDMQSGAGGGTDAEPGDATWFYTQYDPAKGHDQVTFIPGGDGYWDVMGAFGDDPLDPQATYGDPVGIAGLENEYVTLTSAGLPDDTMVDDLNAWIAGPASNFGWIVLGDETVFDPDLSSKRGFATHEHATAGYRPLLSFEYTFVPIPEPQAAALMLLTIGALGWIAGRGRQPR